MAFVHNYNQASVITFYKIKTDIVVMEAEALFQLSNNDLQITIFKL